MNEILTKQIFKNRKIKLSQENKKCNICGKEIPNDFIYNICTLCADKKLMEAIMNS